MAVSTVPLIAAPARRLQFVMIAVVTPLACLWSVGCDSRDTGAPAGASPHGPQASPVVAESQTVSQPRQQPHSRPTPKPATEPRAVSETPVLQRLADDRPDINKVRLQQVGISVYESRRLLLLSDLPPEKVRGLPQLADLLFAKLETHFGALPSAADGSTFQVTGCVIDDEEKFRAIGLMPSESFSFKHGRHRHYQFWMFNPEDDYYRQHLMLHEFTHCFMTCESGMQNIPPLWYVEGMAEYFATHHSGNDKLERVEFGVLPKQFAGYEGWGRISELRRSFRVQSPADKTQPATLDLLTLDEVMPTTVADFETGVQYAGSWAFCWFLQSHPTYSQQFKPLSRLRRRDEFNNQVRTIRQSASARLATDWLLFQETLQEGLDVDTAWPVHKDEAHTVTPTESRQVTLAANREWQDTGLRLKQGETVRLVCEGTYTLNNQPRLWTSEPQGVSIDYYRDMPLGCVTAILVSDTGHEISGRIRVGRGTSVTAPWPCSLWLQINDRVSSRNDNTGVCTAVITSE